jgi:hypothetical protein
MTIGDPTISYSTDLQEKAVKTVLMHAEVLCAD